MKKYLIVCFFTVVYYFSFAQLQVDEFGWTVLSPSNDSKIIYVSSSEGLDTNEGLSESSPVASLSKAVSLARNGFPDHILFKRGDKWDTSYGIGSFKSGRSASEPMVLAYYGDSGARPKFNIQSSFMSSFEQNRSNLVFMGLEWYAYKHDPNSPDFSSTEKVSIFNMVGYGDNFLIEDCVANYASLGAFSATSGYNYKNLKIRRVIAVNSYAPDTYTTHELRTRIQGVYISGTIGVLIEDCLFDHNGWNAQVPGSGPNMFNHNVYMQGDNPEPSKIIIKNNIFSRASAHGVQLRSGGTATDNLFIQNSININIGYDYLGHGMNNMLQYVKNPDNTNVSNNVMLETRLMDSTNSAYPRTPSIFGIEGVLIPCHIQNNILVHNLNKGGVAIGSYNDINEIGGAVSKQGNIIYKYYKSRTKETDNPGWLDPERKIAHYHKKLGKKASTESFIMEARKRPLRTWWVEYSAKQVNEFIRKGFSENKDTVPPNDTEQLSVNNITDASAEISWKWATDNERTIGYNIYIGGVKMNSELITETVFSLFQLNPETTYNVILKTVDIGENESLGKEADFVTLTVDITPPTAPTGLNTVDVTDQTIKIKWLPATDDRLIWGYYIFIDGQKYSEEVITDTVFTVTGLEMGVTYELKVSATDPAGNESTTSESIQVRVLDSEPPAPAENISISDVTSTGLTAHWDATTDNVEVAGYNIYVGSNKIGSTAELSFDVTNLVFGERYRIRVSAFDTDGNESTLTTLKIVLDVDELNLLQIIIYPNPAENYIKINSGIEITAVEIVDVTGSAKKIYGNLSGNKHTIDFSELKSGIYFIKVFSEKGILTKRIIKN